MSDGPATQSLGLDFGTTNTALAVARHGVPHRLAIEGSATTMPSAVFYGAFDGERAFGRDAFARYLDGGGGRLLRGIKTVLGTGLMHERTAAGGRILSFADIIEALFAHVFRDLPDERGTRTLVVGRPVRFGTREELALVVDIGGARDLARARCRCRHGGGGGVSQEPGGRPVAGGRAPRPGVTGGARSTLLARVDGPPPGS